MIDPQTMQLARKMCAESKKWGRVPEKAILSGAWDTGHIVLQYVPDAEIVLIKMQQEKSED